MGNPPGIALFSFMTDVMAKESKLKILALIGIVSAIVIFGSIAVVRFSNRNRQLTPAIVDAARSLSTIPDEIVASQPDPEAFRTGRDQLARELTEGTLPVDSVRDFYQSYALWMRDGKWDTTDVRDLTRYLNIKITP
jgi:hypothetical protein